MIAQKRLLAKSDEGEFLYKTYENKRTVVRRVPNFAPGEGSLYQAAKLLREKYGWTNVQVDDRDGQSWSRCLWRARRSADLAQSGT
jgi:hypothetical protein